MSQPPMWTEDQVQQLLQTPDSLLTDDAWRSLIRSMGGLEAFYCQLRALPLKEKQQTILTALTTYPGASVDTYCTLLHIHPATFHRHQRLLFRSLPALLNAMTPTAAAEPGTAAPSRTMYARHQLPAPIADFLGRDAETAALLAALRSGVNLAAIQGMGGLGKTELAFHVARALIADFPDAQVVLALHGTRANPLPPIQAMHAIIRLFCDDKLPGDLETLLPIYRSTLRTKRVLIVADDARDADQVRPLVPPEGSVLLMTSRQRFVLPGMTPLNLEGLAPAEAQTLLRRICPRVGAEAAAQIVAATGYLPLAIRTSGSILTTTPALPIARYAERLADARQRLAALRDPDDPHMDVAASLNLSYASLDSLAQRVLGQLSVLVADFSADLALRIVAADQDAAIIEDVFYSLLRRSLLLYDTLHERWRMHDLVRSLALKNAPPLELEAAGGRYARAVVSTLNELQERYLRGGSDTLASLAAFDRERPHLDAAWQWAFDHQGTPDGDRLLVETALATQKFARLRYDYRHERHPQLVAAHAAAQRLGDRAAEGELAWYLGALESALGNIPAAISQYQRAVSILAAAGEGYKAARARFDLAGSYSEMGGTANQAQALAMWLEALDDFRRFAAPPQQIALCLNNIGAAHLELGNNPMAIQYFEQSSAIAEAHGDHMELCRVLHNIGFLKMSAGDPQGALGDFARALALADQLGSREGQGIIGGRMAEAYAQLGDAAQASALFESALHIFAEIHDRLQEAYTCWHYGMLLVRQGERERGLSLLRASLAYHQEIQHHGADYAAAIIARLEAGEPWSAEMLQPA